MFFCFFSVIIQSEIGEREKSRGEKLGYEALKKKRREDLRVHSMLLGTWEIVVDFVTGILAIIPQSLYFLYTCCASFMDFMQYLIRKLAGLDVYYVNGEAIKGDIITDFLYGVLGINGEARYSPLRTVFWSLIIFGCILLVLTTIFAIIKAHYNYDSKKSHPMTIIGNSIKTFFLMAIVPLCCIFGVYLSNILLNAVDQITSYSSSEQISEAFKNSSGNYTEVFKKGETANGQEAYASYDFFSFGSNTNAPTFSGIMFKISARESNRVRKGSYTASSSSTVGTSNFLWSDFGIFTSKVEGEEARREDVANMIDTAFSNCLKLKDDKRANASLLGKESAVLVSSFAYFGSAVWYGPCINVGTFSKYNVGLVWYYYNLWTFNFFMAFAGMIALVIIFGNVFFGMIVRMIKLMCLFMLYPTFVGIGPLDGNRAIGMWKTEFIKNVLMGYGAIAGMNLSFILLDEFQKVYFFRSDFLNNLMSIVLMIAILAVVKDIVSLISTLTGGEDANSAGEKAKKETQETAAKAGEKAMAAANLALKIGAKFDPTLKALYIAKQKLDKLLKEKKQRDAIKKGAGAKFGINSVADLAALLGQAEGLRKTASSEKKLSDSYNDDAQKDTENFRKMMEENKGKSEADQISEASSFGSSTGNDDPEDDFSAENIVRRYADKKSKKFAEIDADASLSNEDKNAQKAAAEEEYRNEAVEEFKTHNKNALLSNEHFENYAQANAEADAAQKKYDDIMKEGGKRSPIKKAILDLGGSTIKLVGDLTFMSAGWKKVGETGLMDEFKTFGQAVVPYSGEGVRKSFMTKKQKEDKDKADEKAYEQAIKDQARTTKLQLDQIRDLTYVFDGILNARDERRKKFNAEMSKPTAATADEAKTNIKAALNADAPILAAELRRAGKPMEAKRFENNASAADIDREVDKIRDYSITVANEEIAAGGTSAEIRNRINARVDAHVADLISQGRRREAEIVNQNKFRGLSRVP